MTIAIASRDSYQRPLLSTRRDLHRHGRRRPTIHDFAGSTKVVDGRDKPDHDDMAALRSGHCIPPLASAIPWRFPVIPAKAGIQVACAVAAVRLDPRFRGGDDRGDAGALSSIVKPLER